MRIAPYHIESSGWVGFKSDDVSQMSITLKNLQNPDGNLSASYKREHLPDQLHLPVHHFEENILPSQDRNRKEKVMSFFGKLPWNSKSGGYSSVGDEIPGHGVDNDENLEKPRFKNPIRKHSVRKTVISSILAIAALFGVGFFALSQASDSAAFGFRREHPCGNSSAEALALGCTFDHLTWAWYPAYCPHYTNDLFRAAEGGFSYYESLGSKEALDEESFYRILDTKGGVWVEKREHLTHCVYLLLAQAQIVRDRTRYVPKLVEYEHLEHCAHFLMESLRKDDEWRLRNTLSPRMHYDQDC